jgi:pimeloyl-ACP methyl ester carboxylesterase
MADELAATASFPGERREVSIAPGGIALTLHRPANREACGTVVLIPGWSGPRAGPADLLAFLASRLAQAGWLAVRLDLPGRGDSAGEFSATGLDDMIAAAQAATESWPSNRSLTLVGLCSGANAALGTVTIENQKSKIKNAVVALSALPFQPARSQTFERRRRWKNLKNYAAKALSPNTWARLVKGDINLARVKKNVTASEQPASGERNLKDSARDIEKELLAWKGPTLFVWGGGDEEAPPARAHFEKLHAAGMGSRDHTVFHTIPGANHNFYNKAWREELATLILTFLQKPL